MQKHEDAALTAKILNGDVELYASLMDKHRDRVYSLVARRVPESEVSAVVHEAFVQAYHSLKGYSGKVPFANWMSRIAIRACYSFWRKEYKYKKRQVKLADSSETLKWLEQMPDLNDNSYADHAMTKQDAITLSSWVLDQLNAEDRTLVESVYFEEMPLKEVAAVMNWSLVNTKVRALRARRRMRKLLESIGESL